MKRVDEAGVKPDIRAFYYEITLEDGTKRVASIPAFEEYPDGRYKAWVHHPVFGLEEMTPERGAIAKFKPLLMVTTKEMVAFRAEIKEEAAAQQERILRAVVNVYEERIARLEANREVKAPDLQAPAPDCQAQTTLQCVSCGFIAKSAGGLGRHKQSHAPA